MQKYKVLLEEQAKQDIEVRYQYLVCELKDSFYANVLIEEIEERINQLSVFPLRNPYARNEQLRYKGVRLLAFKNVHIFYTVHQKSEHVSIRRVLDAKRNWPMIVKEDTSLYTSKALA